MSKQIGLPIRDDRGKLKRGAWCSTRKRKWTHDTLLVLLRLHKKMKKKNNAIPNVFFDERLKKTTNNSSTNFLKLIKRKKRKCWEKNIDQHHVIAPTLLPRFLEASVATEVGITNVKTTMKIQNHFENYTFLLIR